MNKIMTMEEQREMGMVTQKAGIYMVVNTNDNNKVVYVGSASDLFKRKSVHMSQLRGNYNSNKGLQDLYNSLENKDDLIFTVAMTVNKYDKSKLFKLEKNLMNVHKETILNKNDIRRSIKKERTKEEQKKVSEALSRANRGEKNPSAKISEDNAREIIQMKKDKVKQKDIAKEFGISPQQVSRIGVSRWVNLA